MISKVFQRLHKKMRGESGQAGMEFVAIAPVLLLAIALLGMLGRMVYMKLASQSFAYSNCAWMSRVSPLDAATVGGLFSHHDTYSSYKATWQDQSAWTEEGATGFGNRDIAFTSGGGVAGDVWLFGSEAPVGGEGGYFETLLACNSPPVASPINFFGVTWE